MRAWAKRSAHIANSYGKTSIASAGFCALQSAMPLCEARSLIGWPFSSYGSSFLLASAELSPAGFSLRGFVYFVNAKPAALIRRDGSSIKPGCEGCECERGENHPPEPIEFSIGIYFFGK